MNTITSLDRSKTHLLAIPSINGELVHNLHEYFRHLDPDLKIIIINCEVTGMLSKEMTDKEFEELKEEIKPSKKSINDLLHTPLN